MTIKLSEDDPLQKLAVKLSGHFGVPNEWSALSGGVLSGGFRLPYDRYDEALKWLTDEFGEPKIQTPWHSNHTKDMAPLMFNTSEPVGQPADHVNLISMMQRKDKRYVLLSFC